MNKQNAATGPRNVLAPDITGQAGVRAPYATPHLERLGEIRELTLGGSPGSGDSGSPTTRRVPS